MIRAEDLKIDIYRIGSDLRRGNSGVRITHIPTGIIVRSEDQPNYELNRDQALKYLEEKLNTGFQPDEKDK